MEQEEIVNKERPHDENGKFASPDPAKREEKKDPNIPVTPTNFVPQIVEPILTPEEIPKEARVTNGFVETPEVLTRKKVRYKKFAQAIFSGANQTQAAMMADGIECHNARGVGYRLMKNPEVQKELQVLMDKKSLGVERAMEELDKGLKEGKIGSHAEYLDKQLKILGMIGSGSSSTPEKQPNTNIFQQLIIEAENRGQSI